MLRKRDKVRPGGESSRPVVTPVQWWKVLKSPGNAGSFYTHVCMSLSTTSPLHCARIFELGKLHMCGCGCGGGQPRLIGSRHYSLLEATTYVPVCFHVFIIFDSHPCPSYPNGAGMIANTSITAPHLSELLPSVDLPDSGAAVQIPVWQRAILLPLNQTAPSFYRQHALFNIPDYLKTHRGLRANVIRWIQWISNESGRCRAAAPTIAFPSPLSPRFLPLSHLI